jgi:DNA replication protein DnaC
MKNRNHQRNHQHPPTNRRPQKERTTPATTRRNQILADCATLRIPVTAAQLDDALAQAEKTGWSHLDFLHHLLADQAGQRRARSLARRIQDAHFRELKPLSEFEWNFNPEIPRTQIETLAQGDFIRRRQNVVFVGQSGLGKSRLIQNIGHAACVLGYRVSYTTSGALLEDLTAALADQTIHDRVRCYARPDLLIIDEFGFDRIERSLCPQAASLWYKIIDARSQRASTALVTNIDFDSWVTYLGDAPLAMALLDRVVDGAAIVKLTGRSYRMHRSPDQHEA